MHLLTWTETKRCLQSLRCVRILKFFSRWTSTQQSSCCLTRHTDPGDQNVDGTGKVLDDSNKLWPDRFLSNGAAPLSKLWRASSEKAVPRLATVLLSTRAAMSVWSKTHLSSKRKDRFSVADHGEVLLLLLAVFSSRLRPRLGALSKSVFSGYSVTKHTKTPTCFSKLRRHSVSSPRSTCGLMSKPTL